MPLLSATVFAETASSAVSLIVVYVIATALSFGNYIGWFRHHEDLYGASLVRAHLAFVIVGTMAFVLFSAVMWLWAARYSETSEERATRLTYGLLAILFLRDLPLFSIECRAIVCCGWENPYQGFVFVIQFMLFLLSFVFAWLNYTWRAATTLEQYYGEPHVLKTGLEQVMVLPPPSPSESSAWGYQQRLLPSPHRDGWGSQSPMEYSMLPTGRSSRAPSRPPSLPPSPGRYDPPSAVREYVPPAGPASVSPRPSPSYVPPSPSHWGSQSPHPPSSSATPHHSQLNPHHSYRADAGPVVIEKYTF